MKQQNLLAAAFVLTSALAAAPLLSFATAGAKLHVAKVGETAPSWTLTDTVGKAHSLKNLRGKYVVLEWTNPNCPYVQKHYRTGNMQSLQKFATSHGAVWFSVNSTAKGRGGAGANEAALMNGRFSSNASAILLDPTGEVGREFGAKSTPDMMIVDPKGVLIYSGGIDDKPTPDDEDVKTAHNYVKAALTEAWAGKAVSVPVSQPYGCGIKYGS